MFRTLLNSPLLRRKKSLFDSSEEDISESEKLRHQNTNRNGYQNLETFQKQKLRQKASFTFRLPVFFLMSCWILLLTILFILASEVKHSWHRELWPQGSGSWWREADWRTASMQFSWEVATAVAETSKGVCDAQQGPAVEWGKPGVSTGLWRPSHTGISKELSNWAFGKTGESI